MKTIAWTLLVGFVAGAWLTLGGKAGPAGGSPRATPHSHSKVVYLAGRLSDEALMALGAAVATRPGALLLIDSVPQSRYLRHFLTAYKPDRAIGVGNFDEDEAALGRRLGVTVGPILPWSDGPPLEVWAHLFERIDRVVVCPPKPRELLLHAACLAGAVRAPLWLARGDDGPALARCLKTWKTKQAYLVGSEARRLGVSGCRVTRLASTSEVRSACVRYLAPSGFIDRAVVVNPADEKRGGMSVLAPWLATTRRAALLLTGPAGKDVDRVVQDAVRRRPLDRLDTLILLASPTAIPTLHRPNPIPGDKDPVIELEPLTPTGGAPFSFAIGRLFHEDRALVPLMLARQEMMASRTGPRRALVASNPGGSLSLLEALSRNTAQELQNAGWDVKGLFGHDVTARSLRRAMIGPDLFLWEGHHNTLIFDWGFPSWDDALPPTFVFLQSCLALQDYKVQPLLARGAIGVLGTSTRTYSASGGAFSLAFVNGLVYEDRPLGDSLRQAKNFLLAYALLKQKRLGAAAARTGANHRAAWAFTLWADPTFRLPQPPRPDSALVGVHHEVTGNRIVIEMPSELHGKVRSSRYEVEMPPNSRLAGLVRKQPGGRGQPLVPMIFAEVHLARARDGLVPRLRSRLPDNQWVFVWDARRRTGYVLVMAPRREGGELRFRVEWPGTSVAGARPGAIGS
jgi:hypothetical protein